MSEWQEVTLGDYIHVKHGYAFKGDGITKDETPQILVTPGNFHIGGGFKSGKFKYFEGEYPSEYALKENDIVVTMTDLSKEGDTLGYGAKVPQSNGKVYLHNQRIGLVQFINDEISEDFLYWILRTSEYQGFILGAATGTSVLHTAPKTIKQYKFLLPPYDEQKATAAVLSSLDDKIGLLHCQNKTLESMAATLFRQWFVEEAQEDWGEGKLGDVIDIFDGQRVPLSKMERDKKKDGALYPYYGAAKIMDYINDYIFDGEYILLGEDGTVRTKKGYPVLQYATGKFWVNNHTHVLRAKPPYSNFFLWNYLSMTNIDEIITGAVQPKINQGNLKSLEFLCYPEGLVKEYNEIAEPMLTKKTKNKAHIMQLEKLRDTLLSKLMSGEVRVEY
jgi:type I restriction enzyme S subunit